MIAISPQESSSLSKVAASYRRTGWLFTLAWGAFILFRRLLREGMGGDGLTYASIARNLAIGRGTFWAPFFSESFWLPYNTTHTFYEHPPLMFLLQSWFFRLFGDGYATERIYCFAVLALILWLMLVLWRQMVPAGHPLRAFDWLPVLLLFSFRTAEWTYSQNYLDCTMSLFCLLTLVFTIRGWQQPQRYWVNLLPAVPSLLAAVLTKGPVALHVLAAPALYGLLMVRPFQIGPVFRRTTFLTAGFLLVFLLILSYAPALHFMQTYYRQQVMAALANKRENFAHSTGMGRLLIMWILARNVTPALALFGLLGLINLRRAARAQAVPALPRAGLFFIAMALATTLPMMVSVKQIEYYIVPALPYLALGLAIWIGPQLLRLLASWPGLQRALPVWTTVGAAACLAVVVYAFRIAGTPYASQEAILSDVHKVGPIVPQRERLGVCPDMMPDYRLHTYFQRYYRIALADLKARPAYLLTQSDCDQGLRGQIIAAGYRPMNVHLENFTFYHRETPPNRLSDTP
ncbi:ArnT family glycosyltransferase [Larkinella soli]|uniref:ArnT family glycosyltransferase n=1 Tax=Larkinella soli TaxID=1770527 RepID=UPI000FFCB135|nr:hypothetical protein [Larkinella soli]